MYTNNNPDFVFIDIPKTGTRSVLRALQNNFDGKTMRDHILNVPREFRNHFVFTVVRDPYARVASLWWSTCKREHDNYDFVGIMNQFNFPNNLESFVKVLKRIRASDLTGVHRIKGHRLNFTATQSEFIVQNNVDATLHTENLNEEFAEMPFWEGRDFVMPNINVTTKVAPNNPVVRPPLDDLLTDRAVELINSLYAEDFELLGYEKR